jgi:hypothetical protein
MTSAQDPHTPAAPAGMTPQDVDGRSDLARHLRPGELPADADRIRATARELNAPDRVLAELDRLPAGTYATVNDIWDALGHGTEQSGHGTADQ